MSSEMNYLKICKNGYKEIKKMDIEKDVEYTQLAYSLRAMEEKLSEKEWEEYRKWTELEDRIRSNEGLF